MGVQEEWLAVWVGKFRTEDEVEEYVEDHYYEEEDEDEEYTEDQYDEDEDLNSDFIKHFGLEYFDRGLMEVDKLNSSLNSWRDLFKGSSYLEEFVNELDDEKKLDFNTIIKVYDYKYDGKKRQDQYKGNTLEFYGNIRYKKIVDLSWMEL